VGLNNDTSAVCENCSGGELAGEEQVHFGFFVLNRGGGVHSIANGVGSIASTEISAERFPVLNTILSNDFEASGDVALEELGGFSIVLLLNLHEAGGGCVGEFSHA
jgi:hypothetical protein